MPITVPVQERQVQVGAIPSAPGGPQFSTSVPAEATGGGAAGQAIDSFGDKAGDVVDQYAAEEAKKANETAMTGLDLQASQAQTRIELAAKKMQGKDAAGAPDFAAQEWGKVQSDLKSQAANPAQAEGISKILGLRSADIDRVVQQHASSELQKFDQDQSETYIQAQAEQALDNYQDPDRVAQARQLQNDEIERMGNRHGWSPEQIALKQKDTGSLTNTAVVTRMLDNGDYDAAQNFYDQNKDNFDAKDVLTVEKQLEDGKVKAKGIATWSDVQNMKLADGNPDEARMEKAVMTDPDTTDSEKEQILRFVKTKAGDERARKAEEDKAHDRAFMDAAINMRKSGVSLEAAMPLARKFGTDPYDQASKEQAIREIYAPTDVKTDPGTKVALLDGIDDGSVDIAQIDQAYKNHQLSPADWIAAREKYRTNVTDGKNPQQQRANEQVKILAKGQFGSDTDGMNGFLSEVKSDAMGKSPDEMIKIANDKLKQDSASVSRFWNWIPLIGGDAIPFTGQPQYKTDIQKRTNDSLMKGQLQQDLGVETVKAIDAGNLRTNNPASAAQTVDAMSQALGGYDKLKPGQPAYNAMQSLSKAGKVVTLQSVQSVLQHYPDGNFTAPSAPTPITTSIKKLPPIKGRH